MYVITYPCLKLIPDLAKLIVKVISSGYDLWYDYQRYLGEFLLIFVKFEQKSLWIDLMTYFFLK